MADSFELDPVDWISAGAVGEPGRRIFFIQARRGPDLVALMLEKSQVAALAQLAQELLARVDVVVTPDDLDEGRMRLLDPVPPAWRAGSASRGLTGSWSTGSWSWLTARGPGSAGAGTTWGSLIGVGRHGTADRNAAWA